MHVVSTTKVLAKYCVAQFAPKIELLFSGVHRYFSLAFFSGQTAVDRQHYDGAIRMKCLDPDGSWPGFFFQQALSTCTSHITRIF